MPQRTGLDISYKGGGATSCAAADYVIVQVLTNTKILFASRERGVPFYHYAHHEMPLAVSAVSLREPRQSFGLASRERGVPSYRYAPPRKKDADWRPFVVEHSGFEPLTSTLPV